MEKYKEFLNQKLDALESYLEEIKLKEL